MAEVSDDEFRASLERQRERLKGQPDVTAHDLGRMTVLPLIGELHRNLAARLDALEERVEDVADAAGVTEEQADFHESSAELVTLYGAAFDRLLVDAGYMKRDEGGLSIVPTDDCPDEIQQLVADLREKTAAWWEEHRLLEAIIQDDEDTDHGG